MSFLNAFPPEYRVAAFATKEARDGLQCWLDAIEAGTQLGTLKEAEELRSRIANHDADLAKHRYS